MSKTIYTRGAAAAVRLRRLRARATRRAIAWARRCARGYVGPIEVWRSPGVPGCAALPPQVYARLGRNLGGGPDLRAALRSLHALVEHRRAESLAEDRGQP